MKTIKKMWINYIRRIDDKVANYTRLQQLATWLVTMTGAIACVGMIGLVWYFGKYGITIKIIITLIEAVFAVHFSVFAYCASERYICNFCKDADDWHDYED